MPRFANLILLVLACSSCISAFEKKVDDGWTLSAESVFTADASAASNYLWIFIEPARMSTDVVLSKSFSVKPKQGYKIQCTMQCAEPSSFVIQVGRTSSNTIQCGTSKTKKSLNVNPTSGSSLQLRVIVSKPDSKWVLIENLKPSEIQHSALTKSPVTISPEGAKFVGDGFQHGPPGPTNLLVRDAAYPAILPDGRALVTYGDTTTLRGETTFFFLTSTAALTQPGGNPIRTEEAVVNDRPVQFLPWTAQERSLFIAGKQYVGVWPAGSAYVPEDVPGSSGGGLVYTMYHKFLVEGFFSFKYRGQGIAVYNYQTPEKVLQDGIVATRRNDSLHPGDDVHMSSPTYYNGNLYFYGCRGTSGGATGSGSGADPIRCYSASVPPAQVANGDSWKWWDGKSYAATRAERKFLIQSDGAPLGEFSVPNVQYLPAFNAFVFVTGQGTDVTLVRWARTPVGPWSPPDRIKIPGCGAQLARGGCYGNVVWPSSRQNKLVITYASHMRQDQANASIAVRTRVAEVEVDVRVK